jgi:type I restriction enzyme R subunit
MSSDESEWQTRKTRIDTRLKALGWNLVAFDANQSLADRSPYVITEYETEKGPADYALCVDGTILGIVEAKKVSLGPQNVLVQAERYSRGATANPFDFRGFHVPFLYSTNGEVLWFHDIRHPLNRSRPIADFHTSAALAELLGRDFDGARAWLAGHANDHPKLRPYQREANAAVERAIAERKWQMLVAWPPAPARRLPW